MGGCRLLKAGRYEEFVTSNYPLERIDQGDPRQKTVPGMPGRGGHGEPPVQGFSLLRAAPPSPLWTTNIRLRWSQERNGDPGFTNIQLRSERGSSQRRTAITQI